MELTSNRNVEAPTPIRPASWLWWGPGRAGRRLSKQLVRLEDGGHAATPGHPCTTGLRVRDEAWYTHSIGFSHALCHL
jgi:hypothetical protein